MITFKRDSLPESVEVKELRKFLLTTFGIHFNDSYASNKKALDRTIDPIYKGPKPKRGKSKSLTRNELRLLIASKKFKNFILSKMDKLVVEKEQASQNELTYLMNATAEMRKDYLDSVSSFATLLTMHMLIEQDEEQYTDKEVLMNGVNAERAEQLMQIYQMIQIFLNTFQEQPEEFDNLLSFYSDFDNPKVAEKIVFIINRYINSKQNE